MSAQEQPVVRTQPPPERTTEGPPDWSDLGDLVTALRDVQAATARAHAPAGVIAQARGAIEQATAALTPYAVGWEHRPYGLLRERADRGSALVPPVHVLELTETELRAELVFTPFFVGGLGAVHGGAVPLALDGALGKLVRTASGTLSRTAYLHLDYRQVTPMDTPLALHAWLVSTERRKRVIRATLRHGEDLLVEAEGLFVSLLEHHR